MASVRSPRRRLAPTVGHEVALEGVHIRAGILEVAGERTVSALVQRIYAMDFINDNAGCFANGGVFPKNGRIIEFGSHRVYFGTVPVRQRLSPVLVAPDPPRWLCAGRTAGSVEVMMTGVAGAGKEVAGEGAGRAAAARAAATTRSATPARGSVFRTTGNTSRGDERGNPIARNIDRQRLRRSWAAPEDTRERQRRRQGAARAEPNPYDDEEMPPPRYRQARAAEHYDEADSARPAAYRNPLGERLGEILTGTDARHRLDRVYLSEMIEEEGPPGPKCFGPRIMREKPPVRNFQLPRDTRTYDGTTKPEDWLADYVTAVYVAGGGVNRRWAVRIIPSYLVGPARIWLNNLPAGSVNGWLDFEEAFVSNFSSTYQRPNRPQQLALCMQQAKQARDYLPGGTLQGTL
ncbi:hypothetical protein QYE76_046574 [Lolium multiflorum]|uniref:Retrotransposon gag domain-containing protein n=1 Tax=Lolium multiflorum TaxID=4521 RepID=A0AAD8X0T7_LOLMU|nr:hypothetical protein QYE76_046574 [Lolium multiflorum]